MKIGTRMPGFAGKIGFEAYCEWLAENGFEAVDTPTPTAETARICKRLGLTIGTVSGLLLMERGKAHPMLAWSAMHAVLWPLRVFLARCTHGYRHCGNHRLAIKVENANLTRELNFNGSDKPSKSLALANTTLRRFWCRCFCLLPCVGMQIGSVLPFCPVI